LRAIYTEFLFDEDCGITVNFPMTVLETAPRFAAKKEGKRQRRETGNHAAT
jgi:hypothetical protein